MDPITHKPMKNNNEETKSKDNINSTLSHMAQWETARLEAEERLARQSKFQPIPSFNQNRFGSSGWVKKEKKNHKNGQNLKLKNL